MSSEMVTEDTTLVVSVLCRSSYDCADKEKDSSPGQTAAAKQSPGIVTNSVSSAASIKTVEGSLLLLSQLSIKSNEDNIYSLMSDSLGPFQRDSPGEVQKAPSNLHRQDYNDVMDELEEEILN